MVYMLIAFTMFCEAVMSAVEPTPRRTPCAAMVAVVDAVCWPEAMVIFATWLFPASSVDCAEYSAERALIELTPKGTAAIESYFRVIFGLFNSALTAWSSEDRQQLGALLSRFVADVSKQFESLSDVAHKP